MRCNQVSIFIERFGKYVPKDYPADVQRISVYCDDFHSVYAALSKAYACAINELNEYDHIGARCDVRTNEFSYVDYRTMHSTLPKEKRKYGQDVDFEYGDSEKLLFEDFIWAYEHWAEIVEVISQCESEEDFALCLKEKFDLNDVQIRKLSQIRLDMLTKERYEKVKADLQKIAEAQEQRGKGTGTFDQMMWVRSKINGCKREIELSEAYLKAAEHYQKVIEIIMNTNDDGEYMDRMEKEFGFHRNQSRSLRFCCANDFSRGIREKKEKELEEQKEQLQSYEEELKECEKELKEKKE